MRLSEIERKAKAIGVSDTWKYNRKELIRTIQKTEGNEECFANGHKNCAETQCCWRTDCVK